MRIGIKLSVDYMAWRSVSLSVIEKAHHYETCSLCKELNDLITKQTFESLLGFQFIIKGGILYVYDDLFLLDLGEQS